MSFTGYPVKLMLPPSSFARGAPDPPGTRGNAPGSSASALQQEDGDLAVGLLLVLGVRRGLRDAPLPPLLALLALGQAGAVLVRLGAVLEIDDRVGQEVVVPGRVGRGAALGGDGGVHAVVLHAHDRVLAQLARL